MITLEYHTPQPRHGPRYYDTNPGNRATGRLLHAFRLQLPNPPTSLVALLSALPHSPVATYD